jgi:hypothetical protein
VADHARQPVHIGAKPRFTLLRSLPTHLSASVQLK